MKINLVNNDLTEISKIGTILVWESEEDANNAITVGQGYEVTREFYACIQMNTYRTLVSQFVKKY